MTRDEVIALARECQDVPLDDSTTNVWVLFTEQLEHFAARVAAAEREACALVAESYEPTCESCPSGVANAIRGRGET
jgi:hypothetical protein